MGFYLQSRTFNRGRLKGPVTPILMLVPTVKYAAPAAVLGVAGVFAAIDANTIAVSIIAAFSGIVSSWVGYKQYKSESKAETARIDIEATKAQAATQEVAINRNDRLVDQLQEQLNAMANREAHYISEISSLRQEVGLLSKALVEHEIGVTRLTAQLEEVDIEPAWVPESQQ